MSVLVHQLVLTLSKVFMLVDLMDHSRTEGSLVKYGLRKLVGSFGYNGR